VASLTWLGHASFRLDTDEGKRIYVDPFLQDNPTTPESEKEPERVDVIALTHGHGDHAADVVRLSQAFPDAEIVAIIELKSWLGKQGANTGSLPGINKGGTVETAGVRFTLTDARHSNGSFAGDTCVFGDMQLIGRLYQPNVAVLPIGDWFTMGPEEAAVALELLGNPRCVPCHYGTFPILTGTPEELGKLTEAPLEVLRPGDTLEL
jgi:L-ascorbate metabolism protein UlaG (beta-lactamase superfamily)